jgi:hypothetical protein
MMRKMYLSINGACKALGAWMYLDPHHYNISEDPNSELLRIIERCLTDEERKATQANRVEIHKQREELLQLRLALEAEEWSLDLEDQVAQFRERLAEVLAELSDLQIDSIAQEEKITESTEKEDRVSEPVTQNEQAIDRAEIQIGLQESEQLGKEQKIVPQEEANWQTGKLKIAQWQFCQSIRLTSPNKNSPKCRQRNRRGKPVRPHDSALSYHLDAPEYFLSCLF